MFYKNLVPKLKLVKKFADDQSSKLVSSLPKVGRGAYKHDDYAVDKLVKKIKPLKF